MGPTLSPLFTLPPELRNQVLETLFFGAQLSTLCKCHRSNPFQRANYGILATNKQLHREASDVLFRGAVLRLNVAEMVDVAGTIVTKTVVPVWSRYVRDRYCDRGTDLGFLRGWHGLDRVRHVEMNLSSALTPDGPAGISRWELGQYLKVCEIAAEFVSRLPDVEDLTVNADVDRFRMVEMCKEELRAVTDAKVLILGRDIVCRHWR